MCYVRRFSSILETGDASPLVLSQSSSPTVRRHAMEALAVYSKYAGYYERFQEIRKRYSLRWTNGNESIAAMQRFFDSNLTLDSMLSKVKDMMHVLPAPMAAVIRFACITGLRPNEACESVRLLNAAYTQQPYHNQEQQCLQHFLFPDIFLRNTKKAYVSYITKEQLSAIGVFDHLLTTTLSAIQHACRRKKISCDFHLCRRIFASYLRHKGIEPEVVDLLQGRVSQSVLTRHYLAPDDRLKERVLAAITELQQQISG